MTVTTAMISQVSPFTVSASDDFTNEDYIQYSTWAKEELDRDDPGLPTSKYDEAHANLICDIFVSSKGGRDFKSEKIGDYCMPPSVEALSQEGWENHAELKVGDKILGYDDKSESLKWTEILAIYHAPYKGKMLKLESGRKNITFSTMASPNHRWYVKPLHHSAKWKSRIRKSTELNTWDRIPLSAPYDDCGIKPKWSDEFVECVGWFVTEGHFQNGRKGRYAAFINQSEVANQENCQRIRYCLTKLLGGTPPEHKHGKGSIGFYIGARTKLYSQLCIICQDKQLKMSFLNELTSKQLKLLWEVMILGDGDKSRSRFYQKRGETMEVFQALSVLCGYGTYLKQKDIGKDKNEAVFSLSCLTKIYRGVRELWKGWVDYLGDVWCPTTGLGTWIARDNGFTFITGNSYTKDSGDKSSYRLRYEEILAQWNKEAPIAGQEREDVGYKPNQFKLDQQPVQKFEEQD